MGVGLRFEVVSGDEWVMMFSLKTGVIITRQEMEK